MRYSDDIIEEVRMKNDIRVLKRRNIKNAASGRIYLSAEACKSY